MATGPSHQRSYVATSIGSWTDLVFEFGIGLKLCTACLDLNSCLSSPVGRCHWSPLHGPPFFRPGSPRFFAAGAVSKSGIFSTVVFMAFPTTFADGFLAGVIRPAPALPTWTPAAPRGLGPRLGLGGPRSSTSQSCCRFTALVRLAWITSRPARSAS